MSEDMSGNGVVVRLDDWEGKRLPSIEYCPECGPNAQVFIKPGKGHRLVAHCCECDYPVFTLKRGHLFSVIRYLRRKRGRVHASGGGAAA